MRRTYDELKKLFDGLSSVVRYDINNERERFFNFMISLKGTAFLSHFLYGEECSCPDFCVGKEGEFFYNGSNTSLTDEWLDEGSICMGSLSAFIFSYYDKSPHWDVFVREAYADEDDYDYDEDAGMCVCNKEKLKEWYWGFIEESAFEDDDIANDLFSLLDLSGDYIQGMCIIKSTLYPYLEKFVKAAAGRYQEEVEYLKRAFDTISLWMYNGLGYDFEGKENGYFIGLDNGGSYMDYYSIGCLDFKREVMVAAELIEEIMFSLDKEFHILPEEILKKEKERYA